MDMNECSRHALIRAGALSFSPVAAAARFPGPRIARNRPAPRRAAPAAAAAGSRNAA